MCIVTTDLREAFIDSLRPDYAKSLSSKSIVRKADISFAAVELYLSGTPFHNRGDERQPRETDRAVVEAAVSPIVDKISDYFTKNPPAASEAVFDKFHTELCDLFRANFPIYSHTYGNAQKFTNILFKYLGCYSDSEEYRPWFKYCHMALDRYTYNGYRLPFYSKVVYRALHGRFGNGLTAWSKLPKTDYVSTNDTCGIIDQIRNYVAAHPKTYNEYLDVCAQFPILTTIPKLSTEEDYVLTPFEAEFFLWPIAKECAKQDENEKYIHPRTFIDRIRSLL